ncbi:MAG: hypothetical protein GWM98_21620, partial [Nitrospinaceae bacterium]|nr:hypothetical protein [Nitrospinaceae bacterium]NIR56583.1 hypothetical protein [Nitrospinaceae bacterium]NIS87045.1 hypothetical protein [Nitrospinaceae bacterium]NIT83889.1 hypothetical protein [Nitrospinaceae bacterium]NIU46092.1 hypothetical protein [Nitrospinaceae bacterium]
LSFLERQPREFWKEDALKFYPRAHKVGGLPTFRKLLTILQQGWAEPATWYHMNTYHFCFLYDILARFCFNYNHDNRVERLQTLPELQGREVPFDRFVEEFFFNTVFLLSEDEYNALSREEKESRGFTCPCQFAVIHGLAPTREELELRASKDYPYSIYV